MIYDTGTISTKWVNFLDTFEELISSNRGFRRKVNNISEWMSSDCAGESEDELQTYHWLLIDMQTYLLAEYDWSSIPETDERSKGFVFLEELTSDISDVMAG